MDEPPDDLDWSPLRTGGALFRTHRAVQPGPRFELVPSGGARGLMIGIALAGVATLLGGAVGSRVWDDGGLLFVGVMMFVTAEVLALLLRRLLDHRHVFDRASGLYRWTRRPAGELRLADVRALQVLRKRVHGPDSDYDSDELTSCCSTAAASTCSITANQSRCSQTPKRSQRGSASHFGRVPRSLNRAARAAPRPRSAARE